MKKKLAVLLCMLLLVSLLVIPAAAENAAAWDGSVDTSWYSKGETEFEISTPAQLAGLSAIVSGEATGIKADNFNGKTIKLTADLDLGGVKAADGTWSGPCWKPIGNGSAKPFAGKLLGGGHKISNLFFDKSKSTRTQNVGLISCISAAGYVEGIDLVSGYLHNETSKTYLAGIAAINSGAIVSCHNGADLYGESYIGGIAATGTGVIVKCSNSGTIGFAGKAAQGEYFGGICATPQYIIANCYNTGAIRVSALERKEVYAGGIAGSFEAKSAASTADLLFGCYSSGNVEYSTTSTNAGPIFGALSKVTPRNNYYLKTVSINSGFSDTTGVTAMDAAQLKAAAGTLGAAYCADTANVNSGYPLLTWEANGKLDPSELEELSIVSAEASDSAILLTLDRRLLYSTLSVSDFTLDATLQLAGGEAQKLTLKPSCSLTLNADGTATVVRLSYTQIRGTYAEQTLRAKVSYKGGTPVDVSAVIAISDLWPDYRAESFAGGSGTIADPYQIATAEQLALLAEEVNNGNGYSGKYFIQTANIDLGKSETYGRALKWIPIGGDKPFLGNYNGQNYVISNLTTPLIMTGMGLFGVTGKAQGNVVTPVRLINIKLENVNIDGAADPKKSYDQVGALVGEAIATDISNCHVLSGKVTGWGDVGGLVGRFKSSEPAETPYHITGCSSAAAVSGRIAGGLVGSFAFGAYSSATEPTPFGYCIMTDCYATGDVTEIPNQNGAELGALIGDVTINCTTLVQRCYATGSVKAMGESDAFAGGLIGNIGVNGGYRPPKDLKVLNNMILTPAISGLRADYHYGRVAGLGTKTADDANGLFQSNYVLSTMTLGGAAFDGEGTDDANGTTKTPEAMADRATWEAQGFDLSEDGLWTWDASLSRPVFQGDAVPYGIYIVSEPIGATAYTNRAADFYVAAKGGIGTLTYTWQRSADGKTWADIKDAESATKLSLQAKLRWDGSLIRCKITDEVGTSVYTDGALLTVESGDFNAETAAEALYALYASGIVSTPKAPTALYSMTGNINDCSVLIHFFDSYDVANKKGSGLIPWAMIDIIAQSGDPTHYVKSSANAASTETANLVADFLALQTANGTGAFIAADNTNDKKDGIMSNITYTLAMDMYFDGGDWSNENEAGTAGRTAAFNYLLSRLKDDKKTDGRFFENQMRANGTVSAVAALRYNAEFAILMSRFADDAKLGKRATAAMRDVMEMLQWQYDNGKMNGSVETTAYYASALVAAIRVTDSKNLKATYQATLDTIFEKLSSARALDGTYVASITAALRKTVPDATGDADATAAAMMALADMANEKAVLAEMAVRMEDSQIVSADIAQISIDKIVLHDLDLPQRGALGSVFTWTSSAEDVIAADGKVTRPAQDTKLTLTVTAAYGEATQTREFSVTVPAQRAPGGDEAYADAQNLSLLPEYINDIDLPAQGANGSVITWASSNEAVISNDGKVNRPAIGQPNAQVTMTASVAYGDAIETRTFSVKVWALVDTETNDGMVKEAYYLSREHYMHQTTLDGYWDVFGAYAALGDQIRDFGFVYDMSTNSASQPGANIHAIVALGENPYNYKNKNYVAEFAKAGLDGNWSVPVFNIMGADAAGMKLNETAAVAARHGATRHLTSLGMGPDIGGWAGVPAVRVYPDDEQVVRQITYFCQQLAPKMQGNSTGSAAVSKGCVTTALTAFLAEGIQVEGIAGMDVTKDEPWVSQTPVQELYNIVVTSSEGSFSIQPVMEMCDLYNVKFNGGHVGWIACGVNKARVEDQVAKANEILANKALYTADSIKVIEDALEAVKGISEERLNSKVPDYGEEYYALFDAVRYVKTSESAAADQAAADAVTETINALPAADEITLDNKEAVEAARAAFDALTESQQGLVSEETQEKLKAAEDAIAKLEAAEADKAAAAKVEEAINALPAAADITLENKEAVVAARAAYDALSEAQQALVSKEAQDKLTACEARIAELEKPEKPTDLPFTDLTLDWYMDSIRYVYEHELMYGTTDTTFAPDDALTRGMFVTMLYRMEGKPEVTGSSSFTDVPAGAYYADAVAWASANGVVYGTSETAFSPEGKITREQMAAMMRRYASFKKLDTSAKADLSTFTDASAVSAWATGDMQWAVASELLYGNNHNQLQPTANATRAQAAAILQRFATKIVK